jgi:formylglycine-generating enzyme required for sulfatase activity
MKTQKPHLNMKRALNYSTLAAILLVIASCKNGGNGELVGIKQKFWSEPNPYGMLFIEKGSFLMGPNDQDAFWGFNSQNKNMTVESFWMDETEVTNGEYKQFTAWVRDSVVRNYIFDRIKDPAGVAAYTQLKPALSMSGGGGTLSNQDLKILGELINMYSLINTKSRNTFLKTRGINRIPIINWEAAFNETRLRAYLNQYITDSLDMMVGGGGNAAGPSPVVHEVIIPYFKRFYREEPLTGIEIQPNIFIGNEFKSELLTYSYSWLDYDQASLQINKFNPLQGRFNDPEKEFQAKYGRPLTMRDTLDFPEYFIRKQVSSTDPTTGRITNKIEYAKLTTRNDFRMTKTIQIYPDTLAIMTDFSYYSYNEPIAKMYFSHPGYQSYPVVGVNWEQANAFCDWRTMLKNQFQAQTNQPKVQDYRLPTEAEWEYAARGGKRAAMYPWGGYYTRKANGCFLANFKTGRGEYVDDNFIYPAEVMSYPPNDYGLFDMSGNVAEWTRTSFKENSLSFVHDLNAEYNITAVESDADALKRKVVKGGSWKDIGFFLQCGQRTFELQDQPRSYIGFRCVRSFIGPY